jgi:O-antigen/teichoic acid export membrane protein
MVLLNQRLTPAMRQAGFLFGVDMVTNVTDYAFHLFLAWSLAPADMAIVQTVNSVLIVVITAFAVLQPVVARFVAEAAADSQSETTPRAIFQAYFGQSIGLAALLLVIILIARRPIANWLNVPLLAATIASFMVLLAVIRPVVMGMLQGLQRFIAFGVTRASYALSRLAATLLLVGLLGGGAIGGVIAIPLGGLAALAVGLILLGSRVWQRSNGVPTSLIWQGWRLSLAALFAYTAFVGLQNNDLIWVNRTFEPDVAGAYAAVVVLRRVLAVLPGALLVILYPRIVTRLQTGRLPDKLLLVTGAVILLINLTVTAIYFIFGRWIVDFMFGPEYQISIQLLGWMGIAMTGFGLAAIWLNLSLATRPWPYVAMLVTILIAQTIFLAGRALTVQSVALVFGLSGWALALGGLALYLAWLRPRLATDISP